MADILLTNDDGYKSVGLYALYKELSLYFNVVVVAPLEQKSWQGKSITANKELSIEKTKVNDMTAYIVNGTPADCVQLGIYEIFQKKPRWVVSGINIGANIGHGRILSSGTAGAGMEAAIDGIHAIMSSIYLPEIKSNQGIFDENNLGLLENPAKATTKIVKILFNKKLHNDIDIISINMFSPVSPNSKFEITNLHKDPYGKLFHRKGAKFHHLTPSIKVHRALEGTELNALLQNKISITPISLELTSQRSKKSLEDIIGKEW